MSRRKQKNNQRGRSGELLDELNALRDLLGSDDIGDIPLLDQVAAPGRPAAAAPVKPEPRAQKPLKEIDPPVLFSPVDEEPPEDYRAELSESDRELLRPLQDLPGGGKKQAAAPQATERQGELFNQPSSQAKENPFLPTHIRARLTGGRVGVGVGEQETAKQETGKPPATEVPQAAVEAETKAADKAPSDRERQRQQLIDRLVAKQLPELERQLRARIELMVDELESKH